MGASRALRQTDEKFPFSHRLYPQPMTIVIAPDSFKEALDATAAAQAIGRGVVAALPGTAVQQLPLSDGGEGFAAALRAARGGEWISAQVSGPLGEPVQARYAQLPGNVAAIEMAQAAGLPLLAPARRDPGHTSTYGVGELIRHALDGGATKLLLGLGGSATNDAGAGTLQALGVRWLDSAGQELPRGGAALSQLAHADLSGLDPRLAGIRLRVACDVTHPLTGPQGASTVFGPQKGASAEGVRELDAALGHFAAVLTAQGLPDVQQLPGSGAAGGLGYGLRAVLGAQLESGIDLVMDAAGLPQALTGASLVLTAEGRLDHQTLSGKVPLGVLRQAQRAGVPCIALGGVADPASRDALLMAGFAGVFPILPGPAPLADLLADTASNLEHTARSVVGVWAAGR